MHQVGFWVTTQDRYLLLVGVQICPQKETFLIGEVSNLENFWLAKPPSAIPAVGELFLPIS